MPSYSLLLIDDSPEDRFVLKRLLNRITASSGIAFTLREAETGAKGLALLAEGPEPDCILLDFHLGDTDAAGILASLAQADAESGYFPAGENLGDSNGDGGSDSGTPERVPFLRYPVVVMTSQGTEATAVAALKSGAQEYLLKERLTAETVQTAIENAIDKVRLQRRLRDAEARFRTSLDSMRDAFAIYSAVRDEGTGKIVVFRPEYQNQLAQQLPLDRLRVAPTWDGEGETVLSFCTGIAGENGAATRETPCETLAVAHIDRGNAGEGGEAEQRTFELHVWRLADGFAATWRDVTDRQRMEDALRESEARLGEFFRLSPDLIVISNAAGEFERLSPSWERTLGHSPSALLGTQWKDLVHPDDAAVTAAALDTLKRAEPVSTFLNRYRHKDGTYRWIEWQVTPSGSRHYAVARDVTEREEASRRRDEAYRREHDIAVALQESLLTRPPGDAFPGLAFYTLYRPASSEAEVGGDFYDVFALDDGRVALVVGDISGKGLDAARHIAQVKFSLRAYLRETKEPVRALDRVNADLCASMQETFGSGGGTASGASSFLSGFVCLSLALLDIPNGTAEVVAAGAEPPLLVRTTGDAEPTETELAGVANPPLGVTQAAQFATSTYAIDPGDLLVMITDGVTEARRGNNFLGYAGLTTLVQESLPENDLERLGTSIADGARAFANGVQRDDVCLLLARRVTA